MKHEYRKVIFERDGRWYWQVWILHKIWHQHHEATKEQAEAKAEEVVQTGLNWPENYVDEMSS